MRKTKIIILFGFVAAGLLAVTNLALANDLEWTTISGTSIIYNTNLGNVGIGMTSPGNNRLAINGNLYLYNGRIYNCGVTDYHNGIWLNANGSSAIWDLGPSTDNFYLSRYNGSTWQDFILVDNSGNVGIGATSTGAKLTVNNNAAALPAPITNTTVQIGQADATGNLLLLDSFGAGSGFIGRRANGTNANKTNLLNGQGLANMLGYGYGATGYSGTPRAAITFFTAQDWTDTAQGSLITFKITPNNSTTLTEAMRIDNTGNVGIGTSNPTANLEIKANAEDNEQLLFLKNFAGTRYYLGVTKAASGHRFLIGGNGGNALAIDPLSNIGIGTTIPGAPLEVKRDGGPPDTNGGGIIIARSHMESNYCGGAIYSRYINSAASDALVFGVSSLGAKNPYSDFDQAKMAIFANGRVGIGTTNPQSTLAVNGTITTKKIKVTETGWSDFVFDDGYKLPTLMAVESHIKQYKHLPGIPSAREIKQKGLDVSDVLAKQMQKIEELTLYMIEMQKKNEEIQKENQDMKKRINALEKQISQN